MTQHDAIWCYGGLPRNSGRSILPQTFSRKSSLDKTVKLFVGSLCLGFSRFPTSSAPSLHSASADSGKRGLYRRSKPVFTRVQESALPVISSKRCEVFATTMSNVVAYSLDRAGDSVQEALAELWRLDVNRLQPDVDYSIDLQSRSRRYGQDFADGPLFEYLAEDVWSKPTFAKFKKLLDNYTAQTGIPERVSREEREEEESFVSEIMQTPCMQFAYQWLKSNGFTQAESCEEFEEILRDLWFRLYRRDASRDSSGFEHVFCGEIDDGKVKGMHNFVQVYVEEQRGNFNYKGFLPVRGDDTPDEVPSSKQQVITIRFDWLNELKPISSMFVGTSPEFEVALYTMLFLAEQENIVAKIGPYKLRLKVYQMARRIGTAYPDLLDVDFEALINETSCDSRQENGLPSENDFPLPEVRVDSEATVQSWQADENIAKEGEDAPQRSGFTYVDAVRDEE